MNTSDQLFEHLRNMDSTAIPTLSDVRSLGEVDVIIALSKYCEEKNFEFPSVDCEKLEGTIKFKATLSSDGIRVVSFSNNKQEAMQKAALYMLHTIIHNPGRKLMKPFLEVTDISNLKGKVENPDENS